MKTLISRSDHLEDDVGRGLGRPVVGDSCQVQEDHPALMVLDDQERQLWNLHIHGFTGREIEEILGLRSDVICRMLASIKRFLQLLVKFRDLVQENSILRERFYCSRCPKSVVKSEALPVVEKCRWRQLTFYDLRQARNPRNSLGRFVKKVKKN